MAIFSEEFLFYVLNRRSVCLSSAPPEMGMAEMKPGSKLPSFGVITARNETVRSVRPSVRVRARVVRLSVWAVQFV